MKDVVRTGLSRLARARDAITTDDAVLSGVPCVRGTRVPAHDIAEMLANGDEVSAIRDAWPVLTEEQIKAAALYARAYPRRGARPRSAPFWRSRQPVVSDETALAGTTFRAVKFLIDECLSPRLATIARERGCPQSTHVTWLGLRARASRLGLQR